MTTTRISQQKRRGSVEPLATRTRALIRRPARRGDLTGLFVTDEFDKVADLPGRWRRTPTHVRRGNRRNRQAHTCRGGTRSARRRRGSPDSGSCRTGSRPALRVHDPAVSAPEDVQGIPLCFLPERKWRVQAHSPRSSGRENRLRRAPSFEESNNTKRRGVVDFGKLGVGPTRLVAFGGVDGALQSLPRATVA